MDCGLAAALRFGLVWMGGGVDRSGNSLMGLGRCHFTSAIIKRSPLMIVDSGLWKPKPKAKTETETETV
jgi:hypothetical protein